MIRGDGPLLCLENLNKYFPVWKSFFASGSLPVRAIDGVSIGVPPGKTVGLVGESGCGKTTLGRVAIRLIPPDSGKVMFEGRDITTLSGEELRRTRRKMQIIFQDPYSSLNPRMRVRDIVGEGWLVHGIARGRDLRERAERLLQRVGVSPDAIPPGCSFADRCPFRQEAQARFRAGETAEDDLSVCDRVDPPLEEYAPGHFAACHYQRTVRKGGEG